MDLTIEEVRSYSEKIDEAFGSDSSELLYNESLIHAMILDRAIIEYAFRKGIKSLKMFCDKMTVFRDCARTASQNAVASFREELGFDPYEELLSAVKRFLDKGGEFDVVVENNDINSITAEDCWGTFKKAYSEDKFHIYQIKSSFGLDHFFTNGVGYRREISNEDKTACGCCNRVDTAGLLVTSFDILKDLGEEVQLIKA